MPLKPCCAPTGRVAGEGTADGPDHTAWRKSRAIESHRRLRGYGRGSATLGTVSQWKQPEGTDASIMLRRVRRRRRVLQFAVLALLLVVNAYLIALLLRSQQEISAEPADQSTVAETASPSRSTARGSPRSSSTPSAEEESKVAPAERLLIADSAREAWRATVGDCETPGRVERSIDGGDTWQPVIETGLAPIVRVGIDAAGDFYTIGGAGENCSARYVAYSADGDVIAQTNSPQGVWFTHPRDGNRVYGPDGTRATPCKEAQVVGIASRDNEALLVCSNGSVMASSDSGESWEEAGELQGTMAVGSGGSRYWVAGTDGNCDGISVRPFTLSEGELSPGPSHCAPVSDVSPGGVAIDVSGDAIWVWAGREVHTSVDGGRRWD